MRYLHRVAFILLVVGGLNWLLFVFGWDIDAWLGEGGAVIAQIVYVLVGLSALYEVATHKGRCKECEGAGAGAGAGVGMPQ